MSKVVKINDLSNYKIKVVDSNDDNFFIGRAFKNEKGFFTKKNMRNDYSNIIKGKFNFPIKNINKNFIKEYDLYLIECVKNCRNFNMSKFNELVYVNFDMSLLNNDMIKRTLLSNFNNQDVSNIEYFIYENDNNIQYFRIICIFDTIYIPVLKEDTILFLSDYQFGIFSDYYFDDNKKYIYGIYDEYTKETEFEAMSTGDIVNHFNKNEFFNNINISPSNLIRNIDGYIKKNDYKFLTDNDVSLINDLIADKIVTLCIFPIERQQILLIKFNNNISIRFLFKNYTIEELNRIDKIINNMIRMLPDL